MNGKTFFAWQIELTTRCPLKCIMCSRNCGHPVFPKDMDISGLRKIAPYLKSVEAVVLEGWGEPLVYRDLVEAVGIVKSAGARPGFVTSGWGLTDELARDLVGAGLEFIGFSLAGACPEAHQAIRVNSDFNAVLASIDRIGRAKRDLNGSNPETHIVFLVLKNNVHELVRLPELAKRIGVSTIVVINPILIGSESQEGLKIFGKDSAAYEPVIQEAQSRAAALGVRLLTPSLLPAEVSVCDENPLGNLFISVEGEVSPCVYLSPPITSPFKAFFCGREVQASKVSFGNIFSEPLDTILQKPDYVQFRKCWEFRRKKFARVYSPLFWVWRSLRIKDRTLPDPPAPCQQCHKSMGF